MKVLAIDTTGFVGRHLVPLLPDTDHDTVVFVRGATHCDGPFSVEVVEGGIFESTTLNPAVVGVDATYYLICSMYAGGSFEMRDRLVARNFVNAVESAGVEQLIYLGDLGKDHDRLSTYLWLRRGVEYILASGAPALTTLRTAIIIGTGDTGFEMIHRLATCLPVMMTLQWVEARCRPVAIMGVVACPAGVLGYPGTVGGTYEVGSPGVLIYREVSQHVGAQLDHVPRIVSVPVLTPRLSPYWIGPMTDMNAGVARPLIEGLENPVAVGNDHIRDVVAVDETPFDAIVGRALCKGHEQREKTAEPASVTPT